jgi:hypothetical protein
LLSEDDHRRQSGGGQRGGDCRKGPRHGSRPPYLPRSSIM